MKVRVFAVKHTQVCKSFPLFLCVFVCGRMLFRRRRRVGVMKKPAPQSAGSATPSAPAWTRGGKTFARAVETL